MNLYGYADGNPVNESDPDGFAPEDAKPGANPFRSEELQEDYEIAGRYGEMREEEEAEARSGSTGRALALRSALNPEGSNPEVAGLVRQLQNISRGLRKIPSDDRQRIFNFLKGHLTK